MPGCDAMLGGSFVELQGSEQLADAVADNVFVEIVRQRYAGDLTSTALELLHDGLAAQVRSSQGRQVRRRLGRSVPTRGSSGRGIRGRGRPARIRVER